MASANVWLKSRVPGVSARLQLQSVDRRGTGYADISRDDRRFRFSHEAVLRSDTGEQATWLVFEHVRVTN